MPEVLRPVTSVPHCSHTVDEIQYRLPALVKLEISEDLVAVLNGGNLMQRDVEEPVDVIVAMSGGHRGDDFVEVQIG
jgi:hypothetical protein